MTFMKIPRGICHAIVTPMHRANTPNVLPLVIMGWTLVIVIVILRKALQTPKGSTDKEQGDSLYMSTPKGMFIVPISGGSLPYPNAY
jgi:hypothetical protein